MQYLPQITVDISRFLSSVMLVFAQSLRIGTGIETEKNNKDCWVSQCMILRKNGSTIIYELGEADRGGRQNQTTRKEGAEKLILDWLDQLFIQCF